MKKSEQVPLLEQFKQSENADTATKSHMVHDSPEHETGRIKRLEKLIKNRI